MKLFLKIYRTTFVIGIHQRSAFMVHPVALHALKYFSIESV